MHMWPPMWRFHQIHHIHPSRKVPEANSNYANLLTVYDRVLGTYTPADRAASVVYGLDHVDPERAGSFAGPLSLPFAVQP